MLLTFLRFSRPYCGHRFVTALRAASIGWCSGALIVATAPAQDPAPASRNIPDAVPFQPAALPPSNEPVLESPPPREPLRSIGHPGHQVLKQIVFTPDPSHPPNASGAVVTGGVALLDARPALNRLLISKYIGQPLSRETAGAIARDTLAHYYACEHPVVFIQPLEVNYSTGVVIIGVLESTLDRVTVEGARWFSQEALAHHLRVQPGEYIDREALLNDLAWVNENSFLQANIMLEPGRKLGTSAIRLEIKDRLPVRAFAGIDNTGTRQNGEWRWLLGGNLGAELLGSYQQVTYQFSSAFEDISRQPVHALTYSASLPWHHRFTVYGSYAGSNLDLSGNLGVRSLSYQGDQWQVSPRYTIPLSKQYGPLQQSINFGFDWKRSDLAYLQDGFTVPTNETEVIQAALGYDLKTTTILGNLRFSMDGCWSPGGIGHRNTDSAFRSVDPRLRSDYFYAIIHGDSAVNLPHGFTVNLSATGNVASTTLPSTEQIAIGGYGTVRGYPERVLFGDSGATAELELRSPAFSLAQPFGWTKLQDHTQLLAFFDVGFVSQHDPLPGESKSETLASAGFGVRQQVGDNLSIRADLGFPLLNPGHDLTLSPRASVGALISF